MLEQRYLNLISGHSRGPAAVIARGALALAAVPYALLMQLRNARYDAAGARPLGRPAISVGNITAGGTGKTPVVQWLAEQLPRLGHRPAILTRGYRKAGAQASDEQTLLAAALPEVPVEANPDRIAGAAAVLLRAPGTTCFVLDDAFQHRRAARDVDLVLINAVNPFGYGHVHPRGLLREPLAGLRRASGILITHASEVPPETLLQTQQTIRRHSAAPIFHCDHINTTILSTSGEGHPDTRELSDLAVMPFVFFTGIGQPQSLCASLRRFASAYKAEHLFDDHHHYTPADVTLLSELRQSHGAEILLTTEKDYAKLRPLWPADGPRLYRLQLTIRFWENEEAPLLHLISQAVGIADV